MSYTDLSTMKKINGEPADLRYFLELNENDAFLKSAIDTDEDLSALDRDIIPNLDNFYKIGTSSAKFSEINTTALLASLLTLPSGGTILNPAITIGNTGLSNISGNEISIVANGFEPVKIGSSGLTVKAANNGVLKLQNTNPASASTWSFGSDESGLALIDLSSGSALKALFGTSYISLFENLRLVSGTELNPAYSFSSDPSTGIFKDLSSPVLGFSISGENKLSLSGAALNLLSGALVLPLGTAEVPSLTFDGNLGYGLSLVDQSLAIISNGKLRHKFSPVGVEVISETEINNISTIYSDTLGHIDAIRKSNGTQAIPLNIVSETDIYIQRIQAYTDTDFKTVAETSVLSLEDYDSGSYGAMLAFSTTTVGSNEPTEKLQVGPLSGASVNIVESFGLGKISLSTPGAGQVVDVSAISKIVIDATSGNIELQGFTGGKEGQMLYIYKKVPANTFTLVFNSATATQKVLLKGSTDFVNTNDYGGITLSFDDGIWREVSRS